MKMTTILSFGSSMLLLLLLFLPVMTVGATTLPSASSNSNDTTTNTTTTTTTSTTTTAGIDHNQFADALAKELYENDNECTSAFGVSLAFSLIYPGSNDNSTIEIRDVMGYPIDNDEESQMQLQLVWEDSINNLLLSYNGECTYELSSDDETCFEEKPLLLIANSIWVDDNETISDQYGSVVGSYVQQIDFESSQSSTIVNDWVASQTNGLIDAIVPEDRPLSPMILVAINSIYLKASWTEQFLVGDTNQDYFYDDITRSNVVSEAQFMHKVFGSVLFLSEDNDDVLPGYQMLLLPFADSNLSMIFVLPAMVDHDGSGGSDETEITTANTTISNDNSASYNTTSSSNDNTAYSMASSQDVLNAIPSMEIERVAVALPKFKFESEYKENLMESLKDIGLNAPFEGELCGIFDDCSVKISDVIQKTVIDVNEQGVEAAAVTLIGVDRGSGLPINSVTKIFMADHKFQFFIYDSEEDLVLFEGRVGAPEIPAEALSSASEVGLRAYHSEDDFWVKNFGVIPDSDDEPKPTTVVSSTASSTASSSFSSALFALYPSIVLTALSMILAMLR